MGRFGTSSAKPPVACRSHPATDKQRATKCRLARGFSPETSSPGRSARFILMRLRSQTTEALAFRMSSFLFIAGSLICVPCALPHRFSVISIEPRLPLHHLTAWGWSLGVYMTDGNFSAERNPGPTQIEWQPPTALTARFPGPWRCNSK
jgi:hypothetical protein